MLAVNFVSNIDPSSAAAREWDQLVKRNSTAGFMQSISWSQFKHRQGLRNVLVTVSDDGVAVAGAMLYTPAKARGSSLLIAPEGPVLPWHDRALAEELLELILKECERQARSLRAIAVRMEPRLAATNSLLQSSMSRAPTDLIPRETLYLDLTKPRQDILAEMKSKGRYNIALAERRGVKLVEQSDVSAARKFYSVMKESSKRDQYSLEPLSFFESLMETLAPHTARVFFAEHDHDVLGALLMITYGERATYLYGGITNEKRNKMAGYALQWHAICAAQDAGCTTYDFYGYDQFQAPGNLYAQFSQFKSKFGGRPVRFVGGHEFYFLDSLADTVIAALGEVPDDGESTCVESDAPPETSLANGLARLSCLSLVSENH